MKKAVPGVVAALFIGGLLTAARSERQDCLSQWVYPGPDGRLVYATDDQGNHIPDFSSVGYKGGVVSIPSVPVQAVVDPDPASDDDGVRLQAAIDQVSSVPQDENGFRGAVLLRAGEYRIGGTLFIRASGVVLRGEGQELTGTVLRATGVRPAADTSALVIVQGEGSRQKVPGTEHLIVDSYVPVGASSFTVESTDGLSVGDTVIVHRPSTANWIHDISMDQLQNPWQSGSKNIDWDRTIMSIDGNQITLDAPMTNAIDQQYGGGTIYRYAWPGRIENVGIENLRGISDFTNPTDEDHAWDFIKLQNVQNAWVQSITAEHFVYAAVNIDKSAKWVTVDSSSNLDPISQITGGRRYSFNVNGQLTLVKNAYARNGRHDYVLGSTVPGPNVFVDSLAELTHADAGPHHRWSNGALFDNMVLPDGQINVRNRGNLGSGHGWAGANDVLWNSTAAGFIVESPQTAQNWLIGSVGRLIDDHRIAVGPVLPPIVDSQDCPVVPRSLYYQQLAERMETFGLGVIASAAAPMASWRPSGMTERSSGCASSGPTETRVRQASPSTTRERLP